MRVKQLEYSWVRSLGGFPWVDFRELTRQAIRHALEAHGLSAQGLEDEILALYDRLDAYPDAGGALARLKAAGARTAILSNGTVGMLTSAVQDSELGGLLDDIISVDEIQRFKTAPEIYAHACRRLGVGPGDVVFHSSNRWDVAAAARAGYVPVWVNRAGAPDEYPDLPPRRVVRDLSEIG